MLFIVLGVSAAALLSMFTFDDQLTLKQMPLFGQVIVLDPGHGGPDPGAVSENGILEKEIALSIALKLRDYLQQTGAYVVMTREIDTDLAGEETRGYRNRKVEDLKARAQLIRETEPNFVISIHLNSIPSSRWSGAQTFYHPAFEDSQRLAEHIQRRLTEDLKNTTRLAKQDSDIFLLKTSRVPAVMVEVGFLSNPYEADLLTRDAYQNKLAASIYRGILAFLSSDSHPDGTVTRYN